MQQPRRGRKRRSREERVAWHGVSSVMRWFGRWLRRRRLRWWWPESAMGGRRKGCRGWKSAEGRGKTSWWLPLSPVRIWVRGEAETSILMHVLSILEDIQGIKCICKTATRATFTGKTMNSDQTTRRLISLFLYIYSKQRRFRFELDILPKFNVVL